MKHFTIIVLASLIGLIQITNALPAVEISEPPRPNVANTDTSDKSPSVPITPKEPEVPVKPKENDKNGKEEATVENKKTDKANVKFYNMKDFVKATIRKYITDDTTELEDMSDETAQVLMVMFSDANIDLT